MKIKNVSLSCFSNFFNYESLVIVLLIIELTVYTLDGLILELCVSKYGFLKYVILE